MNKEFELPDGSCSISVYLKKKHGEKTINP